MTWNEPETSATLWQMHLSASESGAGMAFLLHRWLRHPSPLSSIYPRKPSSLRLTHPFDSLLTLPPSPRALSLNASPSSPFHLTFAPFPPAITINQNRSQYLILMEWCSARTGRLADERGWLHVQWWPPRCSGGWCNNASNAIKYTTCRAGGKRGRGEMGEMSTVRAADHRSFDSLNHSLDRVVSDSYSSKNEETLNIEGTQL